MSTRFATLFSDGSLTVFAEGRGLDYARDQMKHNDEDAELVEVEFRVTASHGLPNLRIVYEHSAICPTCHTEVFIEVPDAES